MPLGGPWERAVRPETMTKLIASPKPKHRDSVHLANRPPFTALPGSRILHRPANDPHRLPQFFPFVSLTLCANCSISPAVRTTVTESVPEEDLSTAVFRSVANFSNSAHCSATSGVLVPMAVVPACCGADCAAGEGAVPVAGAAALAPGGLIAGSGNDSCAWVRISPTPVTMASPTMHPTKQSHCARRCARSFRLFGPLLIAFMRTPSARKNFGRARPWLRPFLRTV